MTRPVKRPRGRPTLPAAALRARSLTLRLSAAERTAWEAAAVRIAGDLGRPVTLAEYVRGVVNADRRAR